MQLLNDQIRSFAEQALQAVFREQLDLPAILVGEGDCFEPSRESGVPRVVGSVGLAGGLRAVICLNVSENLAEEMGSHMFDIPADSVSEEEANDVLGEITNMITGDIRRNLFNTWRVNCVIALPIITRGDSLQVRTVSHAECVFAAFTAGEEKIYLEVCLPLPDEPRLFS